MNRLSHWNAVDAELAKVREHVRRTATGEPTLAEASRWVTSVDERVEAVAYIIGCRLAEMVEDVRYFADDAYPSQPADKSDFVATATEALTPRLRAYDADIRPHAVHTFIDALAGPAPAHPNDREAHLALALACVLTESYDRMDAIKDKYVEQTMDWQSITAD